MAQLGGHNLEEASAAMAGLEFKEGPVAEEEELWADTVVWEVCNKAEEVAPGKAPLKEGWEIIPQCDQQIGGHLCSTEGDSPGAPRQGPVV